MEAFNPENAQRFMERFVKEIGNRESGTASEQKSAQLIKTLFEDFKLANVRTEKFQVKTSIVSREEAILPDGTKIECAAVGNSFSTPTEGLEGELVILESMSQEALEKISGKFAVLSLVPTQKDFLKILKAKPLALIFPTRTPLAPTVYRSVRAEFVEKENLPAVSIAHDDVLKTIKGPKKLRIVTDLKSVTAESQNIIGEVPGRIEDEDLMICGHYDTVRSVMGAHDNAAGTAVVLELARIFAREKLNRTLRVVAFGSEELGLRGSFHHAENADNTKNLRLCLDFDVHGILLGTLSSVVLGPNELKSFLGFITKELGIPFQVSNEMGMGGSDHMPLAFYGVPSVMISRAGAAAQVMHTNLEDLRWCGADAFTSVGKLSQTVLERLLKAEELPFEKKIPSEIAQALEKRFEESGIKKKNPEVAK